MALVQQSVRGAIETNVKTGGTLFEIDHVRAFLHARCNLLSMPFELPPPMEISRRARALRGSGVALQICVLAWGESQRDIEMVIQILEQVCTPIPASLALVY